MYSVHIVYANYKFLLNLLPIEKCKNKEKYSSWKTFCTINRRWNQKQQNENKKKYRHLGVHSWFSNFKPPFDTVLWVKRPLKIFSAVVFLIPRTFPIYPNWQYVYVVLCFKYACLLTGADSHKRYYSWLSFFVCYFMLCKKKKMQLSLWHWREQIELYLITRMKNTIKSFFAC